MQAELLQTFEEKTDNLYFSFWGEAGEKGQS